MYVSVPHTSLTSHAPGGGAGSKCRTYFDFVAAGGIPVSQAKSRKYRGIFEHV